MRSIVKALTQTGVVLYLFFQGVSSAASVDDLEYQLSGNSIVITGCDPRAEGDLIIPGLIKGSVVTQVGTAAFEGVEGLTSIVLPDSVTAIGDGAFLACSGLVNCTISSGILSVGERAFAGCVNLESIIFEGGAPTVGSDAFDGLTATAVVNVANAFSFGGNRAAWNGLKVKVQVEQAGPLFYTTNDGLSVLVIDCDVNAEGSLTIPDLLAGLPVTEIGDDTFLGCNDISGISIPQSVNLIGDARFSGCASLVDLTVAFSNTSYSSSGGVLLSDNATKAVGFAGGLFEVAIPNTVTTIGSKAFAQSGSLMRVTIPESVTLIGSEAFSNCTTLEVLFFEGSAPSTEVSAFLSVLAPASVKTIHAQSYGGDGAIWNGLSVQEILYTFENDGSSITIADFPEDVEGALTIPSTLLGKPVTKIGIEAFKDCVGLTSVLIPESVTEIEARAFWGCSNLISVTLPVGITVIPSRLFSDCSSLESVLIPEGVTLIQPLAFYKCSSLASLEIPETVEEIGGSAFSGCSELATINLPESLTIINQGVFRGCSKLLSIVIPSGVTQIGAEAFAGSAVEGMILPDALITIGDNAFHSTRLVNLSIPSSVTSIGAEAFKNCHALLGVEFLNQAFSLGSGAFIQCSNLRGLYFSGPPPTLGGNGGIGLPTRIIVSEEHADAFGGFGAIWNGLPVEAGDEKSIFFKYQEFPASITITDYLETIGGEIVVPNEIYGKPVTAIHTSAFEDCSGLTSILLPDGLESIELYAFRNCVSLQEIQISQGVVEIGSRAFESCHSLETVNIPASVSSLGSLPFYDCINLVEINVDEGNEVYESSAGLLLAEEGTRVIGFAAGLESAIIPDGVIVIMPNAFAGATKLANVSFPQSVVAINGSAFYNCIGLIEITIPENVTVLAEGVFREASNLQTIYFEGPAPVNMQDKDIGVSATAVVSPEHAQSYGGEGASWFGLTVSVGDDQVENFLGLTLTFSEDGIILSASGLSQGLDYLIETSSNLQEWSLIHSFTSNFSSQDIEVAQPSGASNYYRVRRVIE